MDCYVCTKAGRPAPAVAICPNCSAGLCLTHVREAAQDVRRTSLSPSGCRHDTWRVERPARRSSLRL